MAEFFVFDANSLISAALIRKSISKQALLKAFRSGTIAISVEILIEFVDVLFRTKFDSFFLDDNERWEIFDELEYNSEMFIPKISLKACRDPKDDKYLELAITAKASCIISGDKDLLVLHPFRGIVILKASDFLLNF